MPALTPSIPSHNSIADAAHPADCNPALAGTAPTVGVSVDSSALLQGKKAVAISHNGFVYRLQATKLGKLILTK